MKTQALVLCAIKDRATETYHPPVVFKHQNEAIRWFEWLLNEAPADNSNTIMKHHPDDYDLYFVGIWDETTAQVVQDNLSAEKIMDGKTVAQHRGN